MTTKRIEEYKEKFYDDDDLIQYAGDYSGRAGLSDYHLTKLLTQFHNDIIKGQIERAEGRIKRFGFLPRDIDDRVKEDATLESDSYNQSITDTITDLQAQVIEKI